jgi:O-antigen/teichoic acid export membrane protein
MIKFVLSTFKANRDIITFLPVRLFPLIGSTLTTIVLTRLLLPSEFGELTATLSIASVISIILYGWMPSAIVRFGTGKPSVKEETLLPCFWLFIITSVAFFLIVSVLFVFFFKSYYLYSIYGISYCFGTSLNSIIISYHRSACKATSVNSSVFVFSIITNGISVLVTFLFPSKIVGFISGYAAGVVIYLLYTIIENGIDLKSINSINRVSYLHELFKYGFPLSGNSLCYWFSTLGNRLVLGFFGGPSAIASFTVAYNAASLIIEPAATLIVFARFPKMIKLYDQNMMPQLHELLDESIKLYMLLVSVAIVFSFSYPDIVVKIIGGNAYQSSSLLLILLLPGILFQCLSSYANKPFELSKKSKEIFILLSSITACNVLLTLIGGYLYGSEGIAIARSITFISYFIIAYKWGKRYISWSFPWKTASVLLFICILFFLFCRLLMTRFQVNFAIQICLFIAIAFCYVFFMLIRFSKNTDRIGNENSSINA